MATKISPPSSSSTTSSVPKRKPQFVPDPNKDPTRADLKMWAKVRYREARLLHAAQRSEGAIYLAGIALELLLKAAVCRNLKSARLPKEFRIHNLEALLFLSGLRGALDQDLALRNAFTFIDTRWNEGHVRYETGIAATEVDRFFRFLDNGARGGLWLWLTRRA